MQYRRPGGGADLVPLLEKHLENARKRPKTADRQALLVRPDGKPVTAEWYRKVVLNPARIRAEVENDPRTTLRGLRHLGVTVWLRALDGDAAAASRITGHKPDVLLNVYSGIIDKFGAQSAQAHGLALAAMGIEI